MCRILTVMAALALLIAGCAGQDDEEPLEEEPEPEAGVVVPDVTALERSDAERRLESAELEVGDVTTAPDEDVPPGAVVRTDPSSAASVPVGEAVDLVVAERPDIVLTSLDEHGDGPYDIRRDGGIVATTSSTTFEDTGLEPLTPYTYEVRPEGGDWSDPVKYYSHPGTDRPTVLFHTDYPESTRLRAEHDREGNYTPDWLASEVAALRRLEEVLGFEVAMHGTHEDQRPFPEAEGFDLILVSHMNYSWRTGDGYHKGVEVGYMTWHNNLQASPHMGWVESTLVEGEGGYSYHHDTEFEWYIEPDAPEELTGGLSGPVAVTEGNQEFSYQEPDSYPEELATSVGRFGPHSESENRTYYVYETGDELADGTTAAGRRTWFGGYDETLYHLTVDGWTLFDAAVLWTAGVEPE